MRSDRPSARSTRHFWRPAFEAISERYGDLEGYFRDGLGLGTRERSELKKRYLQS